MRKSVLGIGIAVSALTQIAPASAQLERSSRHTLGSGEGIYNIQLRDIGPLEVISTGDPKEEGELRWVRISLTALGLYDEYESRTYTRPFVWTQNGPAGTISYQPIRKGTMVSLGNPRGPVRPDDLWALARPFEGMGLEGQRLHFRVGITARELDCSGQRVCRRGNRGIVQHTFSVPVPDQLPPYDCRQENTFEILPIDGELKLVADDAVTRPIWTHNAWSRRVFESLQSDGPHLRLFNAKICITRSTREEWRDTLQNRQGQADQQGRRNRDRMGRDLKND